LKNNKKLNDGCLKIFQFLKLLYENNADYDSVVNIFQEDIKETNTNTIQVILNKYINTLKIFGIKIKKENNKYQLLSSLYSMNFTIDDLKAISILTSSLNNFPDIDLTQDVNNFIQSLETRMNNDDKNKLNDLNKNIPIDNSFYYTNLKEQIKQCEQLCKDNHTLTILYKKRKKELSCKGTPKEVIYDSKDAYLKIYDSNTHHNLEIPISNILSIVKSPQMAKPIEMNTTVIYKLKNRLAKTYKLKEFEHSEGFDKDGNQIIINKSGDIDTLIPRLLRYSYDCEVISPKYLREEMKRLILETINQYEE
jgi:predicted DNA-binding transcriptional regulator YafY